MNFTNEIQQAWQILSPADRALWNIAAAAFPTYQKNNPTQLLSTFELFLKDSNIRKWAGYEILTTPDVAGCANTDPEAYLFSNSGHLYLILQIEPGSANQLVLPKITMSLRDSQIEFSRYLKTFKILTTGLSQWQIDNVTLQLFNEVPTIGDFVGMSTQVFAASCPDIKPERFSRIEVLAGTP